MTTFTDNLRIPHLDQNVYQPEVPENTAKNIIDAICSGQVDVDMLIDDNYTFTQVDNVTGVEIWQNGLIKMVDTTTPLTDTRDIILPTNKRTYILVNGTSQPLTFKCSGQTGTLLGAGNTMFAICDGSDISSLDFSTSTNSFDALDDTPINKTGSDGKAIIVNGSILEYSNALTLDGASISNTLTNNGTISGGIISGPSILDATIKNYGEILNALGSISTNTDIDLSDGNVVTATLTSSLTFTFTTSFTNTSFTMIMTNGGAFVTFPTIKWEAGTEPSWSPSGDDLITFTRINSVWYGGALLGVA